MLMLMMLCSSFIGSNTRGVTSFPPQKNLVPRFRSLGQVMEKETRHNYISLFLVQGRVGFIRLLQQVDISYNLHEVKKPGKFFSKKS
jgi:hypothetical protein